MQNSVFVLIIALICSCQNNAQKILTVQNQASMQKKSIHSFTVSDINGDSFDFSQLKGKKILVVNTASKCGLTPQYRDLQQLYDVHKDKLVIVGFPANDFMSQEPGTDSEIASFCEVNYGVTFPMMSKITVKGSNMHEVYKFLTQKAENGLKDSSVEWNFQKYLLDENGYLLEVFSPRTLPLDKSITAML